MLHEHPAQAGTQPIVVAVDLHPVLQPVSLREKGKLRSCSVHNNRACTDLHTSISAFMAAALLAALPWKAFRLVGAIAARVPTGLLPPGVAAAVFVEAAAGVWPG